MKRWLILFLLLIYEYFPRLMTMSTYKSGLLILPLRITVTLCLMSILSGCASLATTGTRHDSTQVAVEILYATDRMAEDTGKLQDFYGSERGSLQYGSCLVAVNPDKNGISTHADAGLWPVSHGDRVYGDMQLRQIDVLDIDSFNLHLSILADQKTDKSALVFVHGFAMDFDRAVRTLTKLTYELSYPGVPVLYSWPSNSSPVAYNGDLSAMDWSTPHLLEFLDNLASSEAVETIHLIAHSLGNRGLLTAMKKIIGRHQTGPWKFGEIVLVAPDVDLDIFVRDIVPGITDTNSRITLYVSSRDFPLYLSRKLNHYPRLGDSHPKPLVVNGIETIDASNAITMEAGHAYFRKDPEVLSDLYYLINKRQAADERSTLQPIELPEGRYWQVRKTGDKATTE